MKFDVQLSSLKGIARIEIMTVREGDAWAAYLSFVSDRSLADTCLMLGHLGIPHRFTGATEKEAEEKAKAFLQQNYATPQRVTAPSEAEETSFAYFAITPLV